MFKKKISEQSDKGGSASFAAETGKFFARRSRGQIIFSAGLTAFVSVLIIFSIVEAGSLTPPGSPAATGYTLDDIYNRLITDGAYTEGNHSFTPAGAPAGTLHNLTQVYSAIPTINPAYVATTTSYLGVQGTLLGRLFNGTGQAVTGGSQANGGIDDYNNLGAAPSDRYAKSWTKCTANDTPVSWCGCNDSAADYKDNSTGLIWSKPCAGSACSSFSTTSPQVYTWNTSGANNGGYTALGLCATVHPGWFLPHQKQLIQAYIDGSYGNLEPAVTFRTYLTATTYSGGTSNAWGGSLALGVFNVYNKANNLYNVRCVRPAN